MATGVPTFMSPVLATWPATKLAGALHQGEQRGVRGAVGVVGQIVQHQARAGAEVESGAVDHDQAEAGAATGLHDVVLQHVVAVVERHRDAVAHDAGAAGHLDDMADHLGGGGGARGLGVLRVPGKGFDDAGLERRAARRNQRWALIAVEIAGHHDAMQLIRNDQVGAGPRIVAGKQQMRVGNGDAVAAPTWQRVDVEACTGKIVRRGRPKFTGVIQCATVKG